MEWKHSNILEVRFKNGRVLFRLMQQVITIQKKQKKADDKILQSLKQALEDLKAGRVEEVKSKNEFPKTEKEVFASLNRALDDARKGRTRRVF